jgi:CBS domain-containing protein
VFSAPVLSSDNESLVGFIDILSIVIAVIKFLPQATITSPAFKIFDVDGDLPGLNGMCSFFFFFSSQKKKTVYLRHRFFFFLEDLSATNLMFGVADNAVLLVPLKIYATRNVSRIFVTKGQNPNKMKNVVTQSYIASYLLKHFKEKQVDKKPFSEKFASIAMKPFEPAPLVDEESLALKAFEMLHSMKIPSIGITRKEKLIGFVTAQDLRVSSPRFFFFPMNESTFLKKTKTTGA